MSLVYRVRQFLRTISARLDPAMLDHVPRVLDPPLVALFYRLPPADQAHSLRILAALERQGYSHPDLLAAALLHDVGKAVHPPSLFDRIIIVFANQWFPQRVVQWGEAEPRGWHRPFVIACQHPVWGADLAQQHGASQQLVKLIRHHQDNLDEQASDSFNDLLLALQQADSQN
jgi:hypothetical protein